MYKCLYCYKEIEEGKDFHPKCARSFFGQKEVPSLPYSFQDIERLAKEAVERSVTVPGVQPKLSLGYIQEEFKDKQSGRLTILDALDGAYILKPQNEGYLEMPENEALTMRLAALFKLSVVPSTLIRLQSGELCYLTKRIDRTSSGEKLHMIDFLQILELEGKYLGTMERLGKEIKKLSDLPGLDVVRFFELAVFNFVVGNNDMHLKNFSLIKTDAGWHLAPAYDLLNVKLILPKDKEDTALLLGGKKEKLNAGYFTRFGETLGLNHKQIKAVYKRLDKWLPQALEMIKQSFLSEGAKTNYQQYITFRTAQFVNELLHKKH